MYLTCLFEGGSLERCTLLYRVIHFLREGYIRVYWMRLMPKRSLNFIFLSIAIYEY